MKNKLGFTLVELLAVIVILAILILIAVPTYSGVRKSINESIYNTKIKNVLSSAERYAEETGSYVMDIRTLISNGLIDADNEKGEYLDPRNKRDMKCDIINVVIDNTQYYASITESNTCYEQEELENLYGIVQFVIYRDNVEISETNGWISGHDILIKYQFKDKYQNYENYVEEITWNGEEVKACTKANKSECASYNILTEEIKTLTVSLNIKIVIDGIEIRNLVKKTISIDNQVPYVVDGSIVLNTETNTQGNRKVEFDLSDGNGSGIKAYAIITGNDCTSSEYNSKKQITNMPHITTYLANGDYKICVEDNMGNRNTTINKSNSFTVTNIDATKPTINSFTISSKINGYNALSTRLSIKATDDGGVNNLKMCISNVGYLQGCSWEPYVEGKDWTINGTLDGNKRTVYLSIQDNSGNVTQRIVEYIPYKECSKTSKVNYSAWGGCSVACGGGWQSRTYQNKDNYTGRVCSTGSESQRCNTHSCDPVETMDPNNYEESKKIACDPTYFQRLINNYFYKFQSGLNSQNFRNALYDCASVTQSIIRNSDAAYNALRSNSRTTIVSGRGSSKDCTCYYYKDSKSAEKTCNKPACQQEHENFTSGVIYGGRILVLSATTSMNWIDWGTSSTKCGEDNGFGDCQNETSSVDKSGSRSILIGDSNNNVSEATGWGACTKTTNAVINWDQCGSREERYNRITQFQNGLRVGLFTYQDWYYWKNEKQSREKNFYDSGTVYVQIFII